jgi:hypothetical protein
MEDEKQFDNVYDEKAYYKLKYHKNKEKYNIFLEMQNKLRKEYSDLVNKYEITKDELTKEKCLRKKYEEKIMSYMKTEHMSQPNDGNPTNNIMRIESQEIDTNIRMNIGSNISKLDSMGNLARMSSSNVFESSLSSDKDSIDRRDSNLNSTNLKERTLKEISSKYDTEKLMKSLTVDFLDYEKDTLAIRRKITNREEKVAKLEKLLRIWFDNSEVLKKNIDAVINSMTVFNEQFARELDIFEECPDLISLIYTLQSVFTDLTNQFKIFAASMENSFTNQIKTFLNVTLNELKETRLSLAKNTDEFQFASNKFLNTKKTLIKDYNKDSYYSQYRLLEFTRYDYINKINTILLFIKVDLPEKVSLFIYSLLCLFRQGNDVLSKVEYNVNANLEKVSVKHKEKDKITEGIKKNKKELINTLETVSGAIDNKEGFLYVKTKDSSEYFKKRYFKIHNGNLIYFKLKKGTDQIDISKNYTLCNLLLSNVKKNDKEYELPFCFEIISVSSKKTYLLQAETEYIAEEWFNNLRNAIANSISLYKDTPQEPSSSPTHNHLSDLGNKDSLIEKLIAGTKCTDCDADGPTWCSINWLCLICIDCSGVHRSLGVQITKIRSLRLDNLEPELTELIDAIGQSRINKVLEECTKSYEKPKPNALYNEKEVYITNKYKAKKFMKVPGRNDNKLELPADEYYAQNLFRFIEKDDLINIYHYVKLELCDLNRLYDVEKDKYTFLHHAAKIGKYNAFRLLVILGADLQTQDSKNFKAIDYATMYKNVSI